MGPLLLALAACMLLLAALIGRAGWVLAWPAASFAAVGLAYIANRAYVFGKRPDGSLRALNVLGLAPYLGLLWLTWHVARWATREGAVVQLAEDLFIGRRLLARELPEGIRSVVDLTAEFRETSAVRQGRAYLSVPILDAAAPSPSDLSQIVRSIRKLATPIFIHCAQGHGRTATVTAAVLIASGRGSSAEQALARIQAVRPHAKPSQAQLRALKRWIATNHES